MRVKTMSVGPTHEDVVRESGTCDLTHLSYFATELPKLPLNFAVEVQHIAGIFDPILFFFILFELKIKKILSFADILSKHVTLFLKYFYLL